MTDIPLSQQNTPYPPHGQQYPPPTGQYPPPAGQYPPPGGQYPPPTGQYPHGQYPPPGQQYPAYGQPIQGQPMGGAYPPHGQFSNVVTAQPGGQGAMMWMPPPAPIANCPPGLEYLAQIDQILVHQQIEIMEMFTNLETENKYRIKNAMGQDVYFAAEESDFCSRNCLGSLRPFDMKIMDNVGREVIHLYRPYRCDSCCYPCCLQKLEVSAPVGEVVGYVVQNWSCCPSFTIQNASGEPVLKISGPCCVGCGCSDVNFHVMALDGVTKLGKIQKQWTGFINEAYTDADNFGITFPMDLDVRMKAVMLGACFLIDFVYFEQSANKK